MPQLAVVIAGLGLVAGFRWVSNLLERQAKEAARRMEEAERRAEAGRMPRDLGTLEYDPAARLYRPQERRN